MKSPRDELNTRQGELRRLLEAPDRFDEAMRLFFSQHAMLHAASIDPAESWSYQDEVLQGLSANQIRHIPAGFEHSIAWNLWHIARIEDVAMNLLVAGSGQVFIQDQWPEKLKIPFRDTGNENSPTDIAALSAAIDLDALLAYRTATGLRTREIVRQLTPRDLKRKVDPSRIRRVMDEGALLPTAGEIADYWSKRNIAGLLLMPATRHNHVHLNEISRLRF